MEDQRHQRCCPWFPTSSVRSMKSMDQQRRWDPHLTLTVYLTGFGKSGWLLNGSLWVTLSFSPVSFAEGRSSSARGCTSSQFLLWRKQFLWICRERRETLEGEMESGCFTFSSLEQKTQTNQMCPFCSVMLFRWIKGTWNSSRCWNKSV